MAIQGDTPKATPQEIEIAGPSVAGLIKGNLMVNSVTGGPCATYKHHVESIVT